MDWFTNRRKEREPISVPEFNRETQEALHRTLLQIIERATLCFTQSGSILPNPFFCDEKDSSFDYLYKNYVARGEYGEKHAQRRLLNPLVCDEGGVFIKYFHQGYDQSGRNDLGCHATRYVSYYFVIGGKEIDFQTNSIISCHGEIDNSVKIYGSEWIGTTASGMYLRGDWNDVFLNAHEKYLRLEKSQEELEDLKKEKERNLRLAIAKEATAAKEAAEQKKNVILEARLRKELGV